MLVLFVLAIVITLVRRLVDWGTGWGADRSPVAADALRHTIDVVCAVGPGHSAEPYTQLLETARYPARVRLRMFKMLSADERPPADPRIVARYGSYDVATECVRQMRSDTPSTYVLCLARPVEAQAGWDETLVWMLHKCTEAHPESAHVVLTTIPPPTSVVTSAPARFLCIEDGAVTSREFAYPPRRPQPSLFWSSAMSFCRAGVLRHLPDAACVDSSNADLLCTQSLWMAGADLFAPHLAPFHQVWAPAYDRTLAARGTWEPPAGGRSVREWRAFVGRREKGRWNRRARLGLAPRHASSHEERMSKWGSELSAHGV